MRRWFAGWCGMIAALVVALGALPALLAPAGAAEIDDLRTAVATAQQTATEAARRYMGEVNRVEALEIDILATEREIVANRDTVGLLSEYARDRAVEAYTRRGVDLGVLDLRRPLERTRREKLLQHANARDHAAIDRLEIATEALAAQERQLVGMRAEARLARDRLADEQAALEKDLVSSQAALADFEERLRREEAERQERERARLAAQKAATAAASASGKDYSNAYVATSLVCPIRGPLSFIDSWGFPRATTGRHQGVDLMSPRGTANVAVVSGEVRMQAGGTSGLGVYLYGDDGNLYWYFHLEAYEGGPRRVAQGEVVGYVGNTGDASGGATHTHFEIHPGGGPAVNPYPTVAGIC